MVCLHKYLTGKISSMNELYKYINGSQRIHICYNILQYITYITTLLEHKILIILNNIYILYIIQYWYIISDYYLR